MTQLHVGDYVTWIDSGWGSHVPKYGYVCAVGHNIQIVEYSKRFTGFVYVYYDSSIFSPVEDKPKAKVITAHRGDWPHYGVVVGKQMAIIAGCHHFTTLKAAISHWSKRERHNWPYNKKLIAHDDYGRTIKGRLLYNTQKAKRARAKDAKLNKFSIAFSRKVDNMRKKNVSRPR